MLGSITNLIAFLFLLNFSISGIMYLLCSINLQGSWYKDVKYQILENIYLYSLYTLFPLALACMIIREI